jgi:hypothetical protein
VKSYPHNHTTQIWCHDCRKVFYNEIDPYEAAHVEPILGNENAMFPPSISQADIEHAAYINNELYPKQSKRGLK